MSEYIVDGAEPNSTVLKSITENGYEHKRWLPVREEIVRCRDCAKAEYAEVHMFDGTRQKKWTCTRFECFHHMVQPDGFCAWGVRREQ